MCIYIYIYTYERDGFFTPGGRSHPNPNGTPIHWSHPRRVDLTPSQWHTGQAQTTKQQTMYQMLLFPLRSTRCQHQQISLLALLRDSSSYWHTDLYQVLWACAACIQQPCYTCNLQQIPMAHRPIPSHLGMSCMHPVQHMSIGIHDWKCMSPWKKNSLQNAASTTRSGSAYTKPMNISRKSEQICMANRGSTEVQTRFKRGPKNG